MKKTLTLKRETLRNLQDKEMVDYAGGSTISPAVSEIVKHTFIEESLKLLKKVGGMVTEWSKPSHAFGLCPSDSCPSAYPCSAARRNLSSHCPTPGRI